MLRTSLLLSFVAALVSIGCSRNPPKAALGNSTFYQYDLTQHHSLERPYPPLDRAATAKDPEYVGVAVLEGTVRFSRPKDWQIRRFGVQERQRFIEYVSPKEYVVAIYERDDGDGDAWRDIVARYQEDAKESGATVGKRVAIATANAQGRAFEVQRTVRSQKVPWQSRSREILLRGDNHVELVQIVHQGDENGPPELELLRVMESLEVL